MIASYLSIYTSMITWRPKQCPHLVRWLPFVDRPDSCESFLPSSLHELVTEVSRYLSSSRPQKGSPLRAATPTQRQKKLLVAEYNRCLFLSRVFVVPFVCTCTHCDIIFAYQ